MQRVPQSPRFGFWVYILIIVAVAYTIAVAPASAHALWKLDGTTPPRNVDNVNNLKAAPCGGLLRGNNPANGPTTFQKGTEIMVQWIESIDHNGHFNIHFSPAGEPAAQADFTVQLPIGKVAGDPNPQMNYIDDQAGGGIHNFTGYVTLPDVECAECTLQLIQYMSGSKTNYYSCADIKLVANDPNDVTPPADVAGFTAAPGDTLADLSWTNPAADFYRVLVLQDTAVINSVPTTGMEYQVDDIIANGATNAKVVYVGNNQSFQASGLTNGNTYYYKTFAYDLNTNYAAGVMALANLPAQPANQTPVVTLLSVQGGNDTNTVSQNGGSVQVLAGVTDANPGDQHVYDWGNSDAGLVDQNTDMDPSTFELDPLTVAPGDYNFDVNVTDSGNPALSASQMLTVTVQAATPTPSPTPAPAQPIDTGSSGGCSVAPDARFSPLFIVLLAVAGIYLLSRPRRQVRVRIRRRD